MNALKDANPALYQQIQPTLTTDTFTAEDGTEFTGEFGITLADAAYINSLDFFSQDLYLCVCATVKTEKFPDVAKTIQLFFGE
jgi:hypothetical protein